MPEQEREKEKRLITITVEYDVNECGKDYPLPIKIVNNTRKTLKKTHWRIDIFQPGYSSNLLPPIKNGPTLAIEMDPPRSCMFLSLGGDNTGLETLLCWVDVVM